MLVVVWAEIPGPTTNDRPRCYPPKALRCDYQRGVHERIKQALLGQRSLDLHDGCRLRLEFLRTGLAQLADRGPRRGAFHLLGQALVHGRVRVGGARR